MEWEWLTKINNPVTLIAFALGLVFWAMSRVKRYRWWPVAAMCLAAITVVGGLILAYASQATHETQGAGSPVSSNGSVDNVRIAKVDGDNKGTIVNGDNKGTIINNSTFQEERPDDVMIVDPIVKIEYQIDLNHNPSLEQWEGMLHGAINHDSSPKQQPSSNQWHEIPYIDFATGVTSSGNTWLLKTYGSYGEMGTWPVPPNLPNQHDALLGAFAVLQFYIDIHDLKEQCGEPARSTIVASNDNGGDPDGIVQVKYIDNSHKLSIRASLPVTSESGGISRFSQFRGIRACVHLASPDPDALASHRLAMLGARLRTHFHFLHASLQSKGNTQSLRFDVSKMKRFIMTGNDETYFIDFPSNLNVLL